MHRAMGMLLCSLSSACHCLRNSDPSCIFTICVIYSRFLIAQVVVPRQHCCTSFCIFGLLCTKGNSVAVLDMIEPFPNIQAELHAHPCRVPPCPTHLVLYSNMTKP